MALRFTKGVAVALSISAGCFVLGFVMAPAWWLFSGFSAWWALGLVVNGKSRAYRVLSPDNTIDPVYRWKDDSDWGTMKVTEPNPTTDIVYRDIHPGNIHRPMTN